MAVDLKSLNDTMTKNSEQIAVITKVVTDLGEKIKKIPVHPNAGAAFGVPFARTGEDSMSSRGFSFMKMIGVLAGEISEDDAKVEMDVHRRLHNALVKEAGGSKYEYKGGQSSRGHRFLAPLSTSYLHDQFIDRPFRMEMKQLVRAGTDGCDPDETVWIRQKMLQNQGYSGKALSWLNELTGGALVAPAEQGELIELLRNKEALINAGARTVPLPPQGRMKYPRQTAASNTYWVGENSPITESNIGTGEVTLQAKKLAVLIKAPNELIRFASPAAEALMRDDMTKSLALGLDLAGLEGLGGDTRPRGVINHPNINVINSSVQGANGDRLVGQDAYRAIAAVEESNAEFEGWLMRPKTLYKWYQLRADAVAAGDSAGPFLFNLIREAGDGVKANLGGYPVTKSTQVGQNRVKGTGTNLTYILGGMFSDILIGMFGAIEFAATTQGDSSFVNDQTWVRGILSADIAIRHEAAFVLLDKIDTTI